MYLSKWQNVFVSFVCIGQPDQASQRKSGPQCPPSLDQKEQSPLNIHWYYHQNLDNNFHQNFCKYFHQNFYKYFHLNLEKYFHLNLNKYFPPSGSCQQAWERLNLQWPIKVVVKLNSCILFSRTCPIEFSLDPIYKRLCLTGWDEAWPPAVVRYWHSPPDSQPICIPYTPDQITRERNFSCAIFLLGPTIQIRFHTFPPICINPMPPYTPDQIKRRERGLFPVGTDNVK